MVPRVVAAYVTVWVGGCVCVKVIVLAVVVIMIMMVVVALPLLKERCVPSLCIRSSPINR